MKQLPPHCRRRFLSDRLAQEPPKIKSYQPELDTPLGGHMNRTHTDEGSLKVLIGEYDIKTMLDIGCGPGGMHEVCVRHGIKWTGVDGDPDVKGKVTISHDYTKGFSPVEGEFDLVWCFDFAEHVYDEFKENFLRDVFRGKVVFFAAARPGHKGHHHVNCRSHKYWENIFRENGYWRHYLVEKECRSKTTMRKRKLFDDVMIFKK